MSAHATFRSFEESTADDWQIIAGEMKHTQAMAAANIITQLEMLARDDGGFPVSRLEHSLQTATRAMDDGRDDEYVMYEYACHEGNYAIPNILSAGRAKERAGSP